MSVNPRLSGFWSVASRSSDMLGYERVEAGDEEADVQNGVTYGDDRTPLDRTIDRIGMGARLLISFTAPLSSSRNISFAVLCTGSYQWTLLSLCGLGESPCTCAMLVR